MEDYDCYFLVYLLVLCVFAEFTLDGTYLRVGGVCRVALELLQSDGVTWHRVQDVSHRHSL